MPIKSWSCDVKVIIVDRCGVQPRQIWEQTDCIHSIFPVFFYVSLCFICSLLSYCVLLGMEFDYQSFCSLVETMWSKGMDSWLLDCGINLWFRACWCCSCRVWYPGQMFLFCRFLVMANGLASAYSLVQVLRCVVSMVRGSVLFNKPLAWAIFSGDQV